MVASRRRAAGLVAALGLAAATVTGCGSADRADPAPTAPRATSDQRCPSGAHRAGTERRTMRIDAADRRYLLRLPNAEPTSLIVVLHGFGGSAAQLDERTDIAEEAADRGFVVAIPDGLGAPARWNFDRRPDGPDDYAFIDALTARLVDDLCVDPAGVFVAGSSNGAAFAGLLACTAPHRFAAAAMVIATVPTTGCPDDVVPSILTIRGTEDTHVPFDGTPELVAGEAERAGCGVPLTERPADDVERTRFTGCRDGAEVVLDAVVGGGHAWPVAAPGAPPGTYDATAAIVDFFEARSR